MEKRLLFTETATRDASCAASSRFTRRYKQVRDARIVGAPRWPHLAPRALRCVLVRPEAQEARAVAEAPLLELVVADLGHELRPERRLLELAGTPAVRLGEAPLRRVDEQRQHA